jgi:26S proteasome regulatory subunit N1
MEEEKAIIPVDDDSKGKDKNKKDKKDKDKKEEDELSPEDKALLEGLELAVLRTRDSDPAIVSNALEHLRKEIRSSTTSMTSVPKPLKFLRPHYGPLKEVYEKMVDGPQKAELADILSVLAMTMQEPEERESLKFKLLGNSSDLGSWGHEFVRSLTGEIGQEYNSRIIASGGEDAPNSDLMDLVKVILPFHLQHHAEAEAVDLLIEVQKLSLLLSEPKVDSNNASRICLYLLRSADFMADPEDLSEILQTAYTIYKVHGSPCDALRVALRMFDMDRVGEIMNGCEGESTKQQMAFLLARHRVNYEEEDNDDLNAIIGNGKLSGYFLHLALDVDVMEPKTPDDIYKSHLADTAAFVRRRDANRQVDSASTNLANTFVNGFVNAGFRTDKLMTPEDTQWLYKNKEHGMMSAAASLGHIFLWDIDEGLVAIDKYLYTKEDYIKAGAVLAIGVVSSGIRNESDPPIALLPDHLEEGSSIVKSAACAAFGIAYAGSGREDVMEYLLPLVSEGANMTEVCLASLSLGHVFVGTCNDEVAGALVQRLMEATDEELEDPMARFLVLGLGLLFFGRMEKADAMIEAVKTVEHRMGNFAATVIDSCAFAGSGNVLKVQELLGACAEHLHEKAEHQAAAVLGIALVSMGEDVGSEMALRALDHLLHYCELPIKRAVPLALALLNISNPDYSFVDQMSRLSHDNDTEVAQAAIIGLGLLGAGTNNSRVAGLLRQLAEHGRDRNHTFVVRIAQGLLHMGKGLIGLNPFHSDRLLLSGVGMAGILTVLHACLDMNNTILDKVHYILYYLTGAMNPRMLVTVEEGTLEPIPVSVRVGMAVETVGQAGRPKTISGFQTHTTPVPMSTIERAELAEKEYLATGSCLEGVVILKKNPDYEPGII